MSAQKRLAIVERQTTLDDFGQTGGEWTERFREWVEMLPLTARELVETQQVSERATQRFRMPYRDGLEPRDRMKVSLPELVDEEDENADANFRIFHIESVINLFEANKTLELLVTERV